MLSAQVAGYIVFKVIKLNTTELTMLLHLNKFGLGSVAYFSNTGVRVPSLAESTPCLHE